MDIPSSFPLLNSPIPPSLDYLPAFTVSRDRGFLPRADPPSALPDVFSVLESILQRMPIRTASGEPGLLDKGTLGATVEAELPDLSDAIESYKHDLMLMNALYRDYSFLASAYLLEPCHQRVKARGDGYGLGRQTLPANISKPTVKVAQMFVFNAVYTPADISVPASSHSWNMPALMLYSTIVLRTPRLV